MRENSSAAVVWIRKESLTADVTTRKDPSAADVRIGGGVNCRYQGEEGVPLLQIEDEKGVLGADDRIGRGLQLQMLG
jgi:hypothetical protein